MKVRSQAHNLYCQYEVRKAQEQNKRAIVSIVNKPIEDRRYTNYEMKKVLNSLLTK